MEIEKLKQEYLVKLNELYHVATINKIIKHFSLSYHDYLDFIKNVSDCYRVNANAIYDETRVLRLESIVVKFFSSVISVIDYLQHLYHNVNEIKTSQANETISQLKAKKIDKYTLAKTIRNFLLHTHMPQFSIMSIQVNSEQIYCKPVISYGSLVDYVHRDISVINNADFQDICWKYYLDNDIFIYKLLALNPHISIKDKTIWPYITHLAERIRESKIAVDFKRCLNSAFFEELVNNKEFMLTKYRMAEVKDFQFNFDIDQLIHKLYKDYYSTFCEIYDQVCQPFELKIAEIVDISKTLDEGGERISLINFKLDFKMGS